MITDRLSNVTRWIAFPLGLALWACAGCSSGPAPQPQTAAPAVRPAPVDHAMKFPQAHLVKMELIPDHLLGKPFMPGGNLATYRQANVTYRQFLGQMPDAQQAAFLLLDWQKTLKPATYLAHMGGYFGMDGAQPVYVFTKGAWIAGLTGLPEPKADLLAREFAMRF